MQKIIIFFILVFLLLGFYLRRLKSAFKFRIAALKNLQITDDSFSIGVDIEVFNKMMSDFTADYINLDIWINGQYLGNLFSTELIKARNGKMLLHATFITADIGLTTALLLEPEKRIEVKGKIRLTKPFTLNIPIEINEVI